MRNLRKKTIDAVKISAEKLCSKTNLADKETDDLHSHAFIIAKEQVKRASRSVREVDLKAVDNLKKFLNMIQMPQKRQNLVLLLA